MKVEIIRCASCRVQSKDGKGFAVAAAMLTGISEVDAQYVGFDAKRLPSVLRAVIRDLRKDHPGIGRVRIPPTLGGSPLGRFRRPLSGLRNGAIRNSSRRSRSPATHAGRRWRERQPHCAIHGHDRVGASLPAPNGLLTRIGS